MKLKLKDQMKSMVILNKTEKNYKIRFFLKNKNKIISYVMMLLFCYKSKGCRVWDEFQAVLGLEAGGFYAVTRVTDT